MFQPYNLTPLDHFSPPGHLNASLIFSLADKDHAQVLRRMEGAIARVVSEFPFLTGMVVPSTQPEGRSNVLQVRPATAAELKECPILVTQHHTEPTPLTVEGKYNTVLMPFPVVYPPPNPSHVLRFKANVIGDELHIVWCFDHRVIDGSGFAVLIFAFASFCHDPNAPGPSAGEDKVSTDSSRVPISVLRVLDGRKIEKLWQACNSALQSLPEIYTKGLSEMTLSPNLIVSALANICSNRARSRAFPNEQESSSEMFLVANIRKALNLPRGYIGNTILGLTSKFDVSAHPPLEVLQNIHVPLPLNPVGPEDIWRICNIAQTLQEESIHMDKRHAQGMIATMSRKHDWSSFQPRWGMQSFVCVSDLKRGWLWRDCGPLGDLQLFDLPFDAIPGFCWIMPDSPSDSLLPYPSWRLRWNLERAAIEHLSSDPLFQWASTPSEDREHAKI
ncbi:uncharacterized protein N7500_003626 [Penicillium coprophilum]|uniref:uncharacterized protein n=1 Tax=Penicillium coprophilum TaxID=36646 RepID=UPI00238F6612|nr:uncharacterized protein N7500_003626 [Penicillium coprophilum]KAJ5170843.1 hypothetical protein N7500_003626 [Penicillium coprophilum]